MATKKKTPAKPTPAPEKFILQPQEYATMLRKENLAKGIKQNIEENKHVPIKWVAEFNSLVGE